MLAHHLLELLDDFVVFLSNLPMSSDNTSFYHKCLELQSVISHLLVFWQTRLLQLNSQPQGRGRPKVFLNVEMVSVNHHNTIINLIIYKIHFCLIVGVS